ncbi:hypothetical protein [Carboxylicivirga marina]|uniref:Uncharacterized protein n=1 Tax=Carboxylicivirga marina TaxID=2800988 RepID=A0ABS1HPM1_9BACT|nr:hypothetical protein [Carboxylicivirga marina]MBK3519629.1 hypothetical protein [Carboxylicivirga marina]
MKPIKINDEDGSGFTRIFAHENFEFVNPTDHYTGMQIQSRSTMYKDILKEKNAELADKVDDSFFVKKALKSWLPELEKAKKGYVPENFIKLLCSESKKEQTKLLKGQGLNPSELFSFIIKAYDDFGFTHSKYKFEHLQKGLDKSDLPSLVEKKENSIRKVGKTSLTDGQLKQSIEQRKVVVSNFFDKEDTWHCIFITYNSIGGKENWKDGKPHFHYFSDKWGLSRQEVLDRFSSGRYPSTSVHIELNEYGGK